MVGFIAFIVILSGMIVIHEFGHFITAKMLGMAVETFSVGFGPRLFGFKIGNTDYRWSLIPLGGYVKFRGEDMGMLQGKSEGSADEFYSQPKWKRFLVAIAGPVFNIITAILIPTAAILIGFEDEIYNSQQVVIGEVKPGSTAEQSGLQKGDRIIAFGDQKNPTWGYWRDKIITNLGEDIHLTIDRNGQIVNLKLRPRIETIGKEQIGVVDLEPAISYIGVGALSPNSPAERAGLKPGDKITAINGTPVTGWHEFRRTVQEGREVTLNVVRGQETLTIKATPEAHNDVYLLGFTRKFETKLLKTDSLSTALRYGWDFNVRYLKLSAEVFKQIFAGQRSARNSIGGPIKIAEQTINTYNIAGWAGVIELMGILSFSLAVINLVPIPGLDGGVIILIFFEWLCGLVGLSLTANVRDWFMKVGIAVILLLIVVVNINDIVGLGERIFSKPPAQEQSPQLKK